jgi:glucose-1-phosphate thymidylyltransferase
VCLRFKDLFGDGAPLGMRLSYAVQESPRGLADAFIVGESFIAGDPVALILGDNIFFGQGLTQALRRAAAQTGGATIFVKFVNDPERFGVAEIDSHGKVLSVEEKPQHPRSNLAITGLYFYDGQATSIAKQLKPSARGEIEITDLNHQYLMQGQLRVEHLGRGMAWLDVGTHESLLQAAQLVQVMDQRQGLKIACLEEIAWRQGWITSRQLRAFTDDHAGSSYADYLRHLLDQDLQQHPNYRPSAAVGDTSVVALVP